MAIKKNAVVSWSSGKDSAYALYEVLKKGDYEIKGLVTTISTEYERVSMHGVREILLEQQAKNLNLKLYKIPIPSPCPNEIYEERMKEMVNSLLKEGIDHFIFGDLFLEDIRQYRLSKLNNTGMNAVFPLWLRNTKELANEMVKNGFKAKLTCVDGRKLSPKFAGKTFDTQLLSELPSNVDPCGENGEFHTFVYEAPIFKSPIPVKVGEVVEREGFTFADLELI